MPKYNVVVTRNAAHEARITVDAKNKSEASRTAETVIFINGTEIWETIEVRFDYETYLAPVSGGEEE